MKMIASLQQFSELGKIVNENWADDMVLGLKAYQTLNLKGKDEELDEAFQVVEAYICEAILEQLKEARKTELEKLHEKSRLSYKS